MDTHAEEDALDDMTLVSLRTDPSRHLLFSEEHRANEQTIVFGGVKNKRMMRCAVELVLDAREKEGSGNPAPLGYTWLLPDESRTDEWYVGVFGGAAGGVLLLFSVLLCWHQMAAMLRLKERSIGILRSLGATEKFVFRLLTGETLFLCGAIFCAALLGTVLLYDLWLAPATAVGSFGVSFLVFNGWTALILAGLSFTVPLLSTLVPLKKFLKKPVVENITGK